MLTKFAKPVTALLVTHDGRKRFNWRTPVKVKRVQLEMKVGLAQRDSNPAETNAASRTDIVVLTAKHHVELICHPNGPGDVVAALRPEDVKVAIEIKAAPSRTNCSIPDDCIDSRRYPLMMARAVMRALIDEMNSPGVPTP